MTAAPTRDSNGPTADSHDPVRRNLLIGGGFAAGVAFAGNAGAQAGRTDVEPRELDGQPVPEPPPEKSAGPIKPGRGTVLAGKIAVFLASDAAAMVTGAEYEVTGGDSAKDT